jgi:hypothetical protein
MRIRTPDIVSRLPTEEPQACSGGPLTGSADRADRSRTWARAGSGEGSIGALCPGVELDHSAATVSSVGVCSSARPTLW